MPRQAGVDSIGCRYNAAAAIPAIDIAEPKRIPDFKAFLPEWNMVYTLIYQLHLDIL